MKILHVLNHSLPQADGYCIRSANIVRFQQSLGWEPVVITSPRQQPAATSEVETIDDVRYYRSLPQKTFPSVLGELQSIRRMRHHIEAVAKREQPDVIHAHSPSSWGLAAARAALHCQLPFVYEVRGVWEDSAVVRGHLQQASLKYRLRRGLESHVATQAASLVTISSGLKKEFQSRGVHDPFVVPNGVDLTKFDGDSSGQVPANRDGITLGYVGSLYPWEGVEDLIHAAVLMRSAEPGIRVKIVGGGETQEAIQDLVDTLDLSSTVELVGRVPHDEIADIYNSIDILVYPRRSNRTTELVTPLKPLEAMAQKKPIVVSDVGGLLELVEEGTAAVFPAGNVEKLASTCLELAAAPDRRREMGEKGCAHVHEHRNWLTIIEKYKDVYRHALASFETHGS